MCGVYFFFFKQKTAYEMRISDWSSDVCSSDLGDHLFVNNIRGAGIQTPPASDLGHFHFGYDEFWFVMEGNIDYQIEGVPFFTASPGDVVTAAQGRWHRASFGGQPGRMATRVATNPYPRGLPSFQQH